MAVVFSQAAPFTGAAYEYLRADDALPSYREIADEQDPLCRIKLFQPGSRFTYYVCAATEYEGIEGPVLTGYCVSPLGPDCDEVRRPGPGRDRPSAPRRHAARARPPLRSRAAIGGGGPRRPGRVRAVSCAGGRLARELAGVVLLRGATLLRADSLEEIRRSARTGYGARRAAPSPTRSGCPDRRLPEVVSPAARAGCQPGQRRRLARTGP
jgi:hypothetical protein